MTKDINVPIYPNFIFIKNKNLFLNPEINTNHIHLDILINNLDYYKGIYTCDEKYYSTRNKFIVDGDVYTDILVMIYHQIMLLNNKNKYFPIIVVIEERKLKSYNPNSLNNKNNPIMIIKYIYESLNNKFVDWNAYSRYEKFTFNIPINIIKEPKFPIFKLRYSSGESVDFIHEITKMHTIMNNIERIDGIIEIDENYFWNSTCNKFIIDNQVFTNVLDMIYSQIILLNDKNKYNPISVTVIKNEIKILPNLYFYESTTIPDKIYSYLADKFPEWNIWYNYFKDNFI
jgi:hypothetical protein